MSDRKLSRRASLTTMAALGTLALPSVVDAGLFRFRERRSRANCECPPKPFLAPLHIPRTLVAHWPGSDRRWYFRNGGTAQGDSWIDRYIPGEGTNSIMFIKDASDRFDLVAGNYRVVWDAHLVFKRPACTDSSPNYFAIGGTITQYGSGGSSPMYVWEHLDESYVCANRDGLIYNLGFEMRFEINETRHGVDFALYSANDVQSGRPGYTNCKEIIVRSFKLYRT